VACSAAILILGALFVLSGGRLRETAGMMSWHFLDAADPLGFAPGTFDGAKQPA
jgi:hypothetical protein